MPNAFRANSADNLYNATRVVLKHDMHMGATRILSHVTDSLARPESGDSVPQNSTRVLEPLFDWLKGQLAKK